jgi:choline dehydrogenase
LANRLSEDREHGVLVLEAGRADCWWDIFIHMPAALTIPIGNEEYDRCYETEPEPFMHGRRISQGRGKVEQVFAGQVICSGGAIKSS